LQTLRLALSWAEFDQREPSRQADRETFQRATSEQR